MFGSPSFVFAIWLCVVAIVGLTGVYDGAQPQAIGLTIASGTILILLLNRFNKTFRERFDSISIEQFICWHAIRAPIGAAFLAMASEGLLPELFANRAGYGDLFAAFSGLAVIAYVTLMKSNRWCVTVLIIWNIVGLIDLFSAVGTGIYCETTAATSMTWIVRLPLLLVPTFILPVLFSTHIIMLKRLFANGFGSENLPSPNLH